MREIKFRAWDSKKKLMIIPDSSKHETYFLCGHAGVGETIEYGTNEEFNDFILMQFTGLKDKNGKEIFEGDIVESVKDANGVQVSDKRIIEFKHYTFWFEGIGEPKRNFPINFCQYSVEKYGGIFYKIIGNIYENPELLGV